MALGDTSIQDICDLVGIPPEKKVFAEFWPVEESAAQVYRLARKKDSTCLYIRYEAGES